VKTRIGRLFRRYTSDVAEDEERSDRRRFVQALGAGVLALGVSSRVRASSAHAASAKATAVGTRAGAAGKPRVVVVKTKKALVHGYDADRGALRAMLGAGLVGLLQQKDAVASLAKLVRPAERIGFKINGLAARQAATHVELVDELSALLAKADVEARQQIAFDRFARDLSASGFSSRLGRYRCVGNDEAGHEEELSQMPSSASRLSRVLTSQVDGVINLPVLKQHMLAGMTGALKNNFGCIHNPNKMHIDRCDPFIAEVNAIPAVRDKQRLVVMDALRPVVDLGPAYQAGMIELANTLIFATDLVAADAVGLALLEKLRARRGLPTLAKAGVAPTYLATAAKMGLGVCDLSAIEVVTIEV
jgi:uncharacterized protein (DUF362 family)